MAQASWGYVSALDIKEFVMTGRPVVPWPLLNHQPQLLTLSVLITDVSARSSPKHRLVGPVQSEVVAFSDLERLPIRPGCLDCLLVLIQESIKSNNLSLISALRPLLGPEGMYVVIFPGPPEVDTLTTIETALASLEWSICTLRHVRLKDEAMFGQKVLDVGKQVLLPRQLQQGQLDFTLVQVQARRQGGVQERRLRAMVEASEALCSLPETSGGMSAEDVELMRLPLPSIGCYPHLANYYGWGETYPELQLLLDNFEVLQREAMAVSGWTPWPEYHFREGGQSDWRVFPFVHTFPASDPTKTRWIEATCRHCPGTAALLRRLPSLRTALFSRLGPDTKLSGHTGWEDLANFVLRCHLTVKTPAGRFCGTWVEGEVRYHRERDFIVFDDSKIHKAFNMHPSESRIVLILDMARPPGVPVGVAKGGHTPELDSFINAF